MRELLQKHGKRATYVAGLVVVMEIAFFGLLEVYSNISATDLSGGAVPIKYLQDTPPTPTPLPGSCATGNTGIRNPVTEAFDTGGDGDGFELNPADAFADGGGNASNINGAGDRHRFYNYGVSIPVGCGIVGIEVRLDWWLDSLTGTNKIGAELSWDGGTTWTTIKEDGVESTTEVTVILGGSADTWGRSWAVTDTSQANFRVRVASTGSASRDFYLDWVAVKAYYAGAVVSGTVTPSATETNIIDGGKTIVITLTNDTWDSTIGGDNSKTDDLIDGIDSAQGEETGWDAEVKNNMTFNDVVRTSDTVVTITLAAESTYNITATETITITIPATAVVGGRAIGAAPTFDITLGGGGGIQFVKNVGSDQCGDTTSTVTVPAAGVASGNTLVVAFVVRNTGGVGGTVSVADSGSNTYAIDVDIADSSDQVRTVILSANVGTALVQDDTITVTHPTGTSLGAVVDEFSGIVSSSWVDDTGSGEGNSSTPSASATTTNADDLLYGAVGSHNIRTYTEATSWTTLTELAMNCGGGPAKADNHTAYRIVSATDSYSYAPTISQSDKWAAAIASYKAE